MVHSGYHGDTRVPVYNRLMKPRLQPDEGYRCQAGDVGVHCLRDDGDDIRWFVSRHRILTMIAFAPAVQRACFMYVETWSEGRSGLPIQRS